MIRNVTLGAGIFGFLVLVTALDINARYSEVLFAGVLTALFFSLTKGIGMSEGQQDSIKAVTPLGSAEFSGPNLFGRTLGSHVVTNLLLVAIGALLLYHDSSTSEVLKKQIAAIEISNYLNTQTEERKLEIGKRMQVPEALRRQMTP